MSSNMVTVRRLGAGDVLEARAMFIALNRARGWGSSCASPAHITSLLNDESFWIWAAFKGSHPVGYAVGHAFTLWTSGERVLQLHDITVGMACAKQLVAAALLRAITAGSTAAGIRRMFGLCPQEDSETSELLSAYCAAEVNATFFLLSPQIGLPPSALT